jgi:predicted Fe-Mo cluster-binding NifX family protein
MKICVSATSNTLDASVDPRLGRCPYLIIVDTETMQFEAVPNITSGSMGGGAGIQAAQIIINKSAKVVINGNVGPSALQALSAAGISVITGAYGSVREVVEKYKRRELKEVNAPTVRGHFGIGAGRRHRGYSNP